MIPEVTDVPLWANILIYMEMYQYYLLAAILPTIYLVIVRLFGFPLLQRFNQEVVIILYPTKAKFAKLTNNFQPYFNFKNGVYWQSNALHNVNNFHKFREDKSAKTGKCCAMFLGENNEEMLCNLTKKQHRDIRYNVRPNSNELHIVTHAVNQEVFNMTRNPAKLNELVNGDHKIKPMPGHSIWIMKNFTQHFHRHWEIVVDPEGKYYELRAVPNRQQFSVSLWHTIGVTLQRIETIENEIPVEVSGGSRQKLTTVSITNQMVVSQITFAKEWQNFNANSTYRILQRTKRIENKFDNWVTGAINWMPIIVLGGAVAAIGLVIFLMHGSSPTLGPMPK